MDVPSSVEPTVTQIATTLEEVWDNFDPSLAVDPDSEFYVPRQDDELGRLAFDLRRLKPGAGFKAFLCGHGGSGKTTELKRLARRTDVAERFVPVQVSVQAFGKDTVDLTHDALMVEVGLALVEAGSAHGIREHWAEDLAAWGRDVVKTFLKQEAAESEAGLKGDAWLAYFKAALRVRRQWKIEEAQRFEPRVSELVALLGGIAQDIENRSNRRVLVLVDDLEKGDSEGHRTMHLRLFSEHYETLVQPRFPMVYTLPVYFRALPESRIPQDHRVEDKGLSEPPLETGHAGHRLMRGYVERRVAEVDRFFDSGALDALLLIGGGLFRETARTIRLAAMRALLEGADRVGVRHVREAGQQIRKDYQPMIRGDAVGVLEAVLESRSGWIEGVEPYLQSRAVVEYENGDIWLDVRSVLKDYVHALRPIGS